MGRKVDEIIKSSELTIETRCAYCGKTFERFGGHEWGYCGRNRRGKVERYVFYCSYKCMRAAEETKGNQRMRGTGYDWY